MIKIKNSLPLLLLPLLSPLALHAGSSDAIIKCQSGSGRTFLSFLDQDIQGTFQGGTFTVDKKTINFHPEHDYKTGKIYPYSWMVVDMKEGVYTLNYYDPKTYTTLVFYALPKSVEKIEKEDFDAYYRFNAIVEQRSSDPREKSGRLKKPIWLGCTMRYAI
jgi:hypothetical protein